MLPAAGAPGWRPSRRALLVLVACYWAYLVNGVVNSEIGPSLLGIVHSFHINLATAGVIFTAQFAGYLPGSLGAGWAADRWGYRRILVPATLLMGVGVAGTALVGTWPAAVALMAVGGFGFGMDDVLCNAVVAAEAPREGGAALNLLHTFFGVGALLGPLLAGLLLTTITGWHTLFLLTGALALSGTVLFLLVPIPLPPHLRATSASTTPARPGARPTDGALQVDRRLWLMACLLFLFVGMEQLTGGWLSAYLTRVFGTKLDVAASSASLYWAAVTLGRLLASAAALRFSNERLLSGSAILALCALVALALAGGMGAALVAVGVVGLGFAPIYPTMMAIAARAYPRRFATFAGLLVAAGGLGGAAFPWLGGVVGQTWGLRATFDLDVAVALAFLAVLALFLHLPARTEV